MNKKIFLFILCLLTCFYYIHNQNLLTSNQQHTPCLTTNISYCKKTISQDKYTSIQNSLAKKIIRFHVIGNSNSYIDQDIKLKIKDAIVKTYSPLFNNVVHKDVAKKIIKDNLNNITYTAKQILSNHDISYSVKTKLSTRYFPIKQYGDIILPAGNYEAISIELGKASGKNWWCVLYPSLCFVTPKNSNLTNSYHANFKNILTSSEYNYIKYQPSTKINYTSFFSQLFL